jgi:O-antigen ligase
VAVSVSKRAEKSRAAAHRAGASLKLNFDPLRLFLALLMLLVVGRVQQHWRIIAVFRPALVLAGFTMIYAFMNPRKLAPEGLFRTWPARLVAALGIWACLSAPFGISLGGSGRFILEDYSKTLIFCFLLIAAIRDARDLYTFVWSYVVSCAILVWFSIFVFGLHKTSGSSLARLSSGYTWDPNDLGLVLLIGLALSLLAFQTSRGQLRVLAGATIVGIGVALARSGSRGAFLGLAVFGIFLLVMLNAIPLVKRVGFMLATAIALAIAAPPGYWEQMQTLFHPKSDYNYTALNGRREVWTRGMGYLWGSPVFGLGIHNFWRAECIEGDKAKDAQLGHGIRCTPPHNSYLEAAVETGLPGIAMWASLVWGGIIAMFRLRRRLPRAWLKGDDEERFLYLASMYLPLAMIGFAVTSFFLSFAWVDMLYILAAFMSGLYICVGRKLQSAGGRGSTVVARRRGRRRGDPVAPRFLTAPGPVVIPGPPEASA